VLSVENKRLGGNIIKKQLDSLNRYINTSHKEGGSTSELGCLDGSSEKTPD
jgi:hypothetical protein